MTKLRYMASIVCMSLAIKGYSVDGLTSGGKMSPAQRQQQLTKEHLTPEEYAESPRARAEEQSFREYEDKALSLLSHKNQLAYRMLNENDRQNVVHSFRQGKDPHKALMNILTLDQKNGVDHKTAFGNWSKSPSDKGTNGDQVRSWEKADGTNNAMMEKRMRMMDQRMQLMEKKLDSMEQRLQMMNGKSYRKPMTSAAEKKADQQDVSLDTNQQAEKQDVPAESAQVPENQGVFFEASEEAVILPVGYTRRASAKTVKYAQLSDDDSLPMDQRMQLLQQRMQEMQQRMEQVQRQLQRLDERTGGYGKGLKASRNPESVDQEDAVTWGDKKSAADAAPRSPAQKSLDQKSLKEPKNYKSWGDKMKDSQKSWDKKGQDAQKSWGDKYNKNREQLDKKMKDSQKSWGDKYNKNREQLNKKMRDSQTSYGDKSDSTRKALNNEAKRTRKSMDDKAKSARKSMDDKARGRSPAEKSMHSHEAEKAKGKKGWWQ